MLQTQKEKEKKRVKKKNYTCTRKQKEHGSERSHNNLKENEPPHDKTNNVACAPSKDSDQPGHAPSLISLCCPHEESLGP